MSDFFLYRDNDIDMGYQQDENPVSEHFKAHTHETYELYCFLGGKGIYRVEGTPYPLKAGDILIMRPPNRIILI
ncbi:MAG: AraC family ligand binding domain-containing protein [Oscillospiraceae bacterium]